jgi:uncharacterized protein YndB with AHSA1/START domain
VTTSSLLLTREIKVAASPATVYRCLTEQAMIVKWFGRKVVADASIGGALSVEINDTATAAGEFTVLVPNEKVAFTFGWVQEHHEVPAGSTLVEFELVPDGDHTLVRFSHSGLPTEELVGKHGQGWDHYIPRLGELAEGKDPGTDPFGNPEEK